MLSVTNSCDTAPFTGASKFPPTLSPAQNDSDCIAQLRNELTALVLREKDYFRRNANSILHNSADAEDIVHSAFCSAWKALPAFRGDSSIKTWFTRIVRNTALIALRNGRTNRTVFFEDNPDYMKAFEAQSSSRVEDPEMIAVRQERLDLVEHHLESLPTETRIILMLHFSSDCSIETIGQMRGKSRPSVVSHLHRGKTLLRKKVRWIPAGKPRSQQATMFH